MSNLAEFVETTIEKGKKESGNFKELEDILEKLDKKPKIVYTSYEVVSNT